MPDSETSRPDQQKSGGPDKRHPHFGKLAPDEVQADPAYWALRAGMAEAEVMIVERALKEAIDYMPDGYTDCAGYKCRQPNCQACFGDNAEDGSERKKKLRAVLNA